MPAAPPPFPPQLLPRKPPTLVNALTLFFVAVSLALFGLSLFLPGFLFAEHAPVYGHTLLFWGWWGLMFANAGWLGNIFYTLTVCSIMSRYRWVSALFGVIAVICALDSLRVTVWYFSEANSTPIIGFGRAFYVWLAAISLLALTAILRALILRRRRVRTRKR